MYHQIHTHLCIRHEVQTIYMKKTRITKGINLQNLLDENNHVNV